MAEMFKQEQKFQQPIQATKEEEKLVTSGQLQQEQQQEQQLTQQEKAMSAESSMILKSDNYSENDNSDPADPPMEFTDEQQREWYDRRNAARV